MNTNLWWLLAAIIGAYLGPKDGDAKGFLPPSLPPEVVEQEAPPEPAPAPAPEPPPSPPSRTETVEAPTIIDSRVPRSAYQYQRDLIRNARVVWGLDAPVAAFAGQLHQESAWRKDAKSPFASGLSQFTPATADWISTVYASELGENQPLNPAWALRALVRYDLHLYTRVKPADTNCDRFLFALSDYNGGSGWRMKRQRLSASPGSWETTAVMNPGITPGNQRENQEYPHRIVYKWQPLYSLWGPSICT